MLFILDNGPGRERNDPGVLVPYRLVCPSVGANRLVCSPARLSITGCCGRSECRSLVEEAVCIRRLIGDGGPVPSLELSVEAVSDAVDSVNFDDVLDIVLGSCLACSPEKGRGRSR